MLNIDRVLDRVVKRRLLTAEQALVARLMHYETQFTIPSGGSFATPATIPVPPQVFSGGCVLVGIDADCIPDGSPTNPNLTGRERFEIQFSYPTGDALLNALGQASAIFGRNGEKQFPERELFMPAQQNIQITAQSRLPEQLRVTVDFAALIWAFAR